MTTKDINQIETGDRFFILGEKKPNSNYPTFLSRQIRWWMEVYGKQLGIPKAWIGSHATTLVWIADKLYVCESIDGGFRVHSFTACYDLDTDNYIIVRNIDGYTDEQKKAITQYVLELSAVSITYNFLNFIQWIVYVLSGFISKKHRINLFFKNPKRINYCYQSTYMGMKSICPQIFNKNIQTVSWFDVFDPEKQKIIIDHRL